MVAKKRKKRTKKAEVYKGATVIFGPLPYGTYDSGWLSMLVDLFGFLKGRK